MGANTAWQRSGYRPHKCLPAEPVSVGLGRPCECGKVRLFGSTQQCTVVGWCFAAHKRINVRNSHGTTYFTVGAPTVVRCCSFVCRACFVLARFRFFLRALNSVGCVSPMQINCPALCYCTALPHYWLTVNRCCVAILFLQLLLMLRSI